MWAPFYVSKIIKITIVLALKSMNKRKRLYWGTWAEEDGGEFWTRETEQFFFHLSQNINCFNMFSGLAQLVPKNCSPCSFRSVSCRKAQLSWGQCMLVRKLKPLRTASLRWCSAGKSYWRPVRSVEWRSPQRQTSWGSSGLSETRSCGWTRSSVR